MGEDTEECLGNKLSLLKLRKYENNEQGNIEMSESIKEDCDTSDEGIDINDEVSDDDDKILEPLSIVDPEPIQYIR